MLVPMPLAISDALHGTIGLVLIFFVMFPVIAQGLIAFVTFAVTLGRPVASSAGKETSEPPPAIALIAPAPMPAGTSRATSLRSTGVAGPPSR